MKVVACLYFPTLGGGFAEKQTFRSIGEVMDEFWSMVQTADRFGGQMPEGSVFHPTCLDYPMFCLSVGPKGGIVRERA